jgi:uncharacterized pyridoxal phosphate-containing UPF0001 family protein
MVTYAEFEARAQALLSRVAAACAACGRDPGSVRILPVTKTHPADAAAFSARFGWTAVGENRVQEAAAKRALAPAGIRWELIGHLQVNAGDDPAKFGCDLADAPRLLDAALASPALRVEGLMAIAPLDDDPDVARRTFDRLRACRDTLAARSGLALPELSMGMSGDLEPAVAAGSTCLRVGSALFGARPSPA